VLAAYRASPHSATGFSPNRLFLGRETQMPIDLVWGDPGGVDGTRKPLDEFVELMKNSTKSAYQLARKQLQVAAERRKTTYDIRMRKREFGVGDWV